MIEVRSIYKKRKVKRGSDIIITELKVVGHANSGNDVDIKCCSGVSAILFGFSKLVTGCNETLVMEKGYFHYKTFYSSSEMNYYLNLVVTQLYEVYRTYPSLFSKFDLIEKENY